MPGTDLKLIVDILITIKWEARSVTGFRVTQMWCLISKSMVCHTICSRPIYETTDSLYSLNSGTVEDSGPSVTWDFDAGTMRHQQKTRSEEENGEEEEGEVGGKDRKRLTLVETEDIEFSPQMSVDETLLAVNHRVSIVEGEGEEEGDQSNSMKRSSVIRVDEEEEENAVVSLRDALMVLDGSSLSLSLSLSRMLCLLG